MTAASGLKFFSTTAHPCSYLEGQTAVTLFADPDTPIDGKTYTELSDMGFRRSGSYVYRPHCEHCQACIPVRIRVSAFIANRQQSRIWKRNQDLQVIPVKAAFNKEHYRLYESYINARHSDGDMYPPSQAQYTHFLTSTWSNTVFYEMRLNGELKAVAVCDVLENGLSAVYTFYDPEESKRSLGTFAILWQLEECKRLSLPSLYLGYWIKNCQKMKYKVGFRPIELLINNEWLTAR